MATSPAALPENSGRITAADADYAYGSAKDDSTGTTGDGTPIKKAWMNDIYGFFQAIFLKAGIVPSGSAETQLVSQFLEGLENIITPINTITGLQATWNSATSVSIGKGTATTLGASVPIVNTASAFTKLTSATWVAGSGNGGLAAGAAVVANASLYMFIMKLADGTTDFIFDDVPAGTNAIVDASPDEIRGVLGIALSGVPEIIEFFDRGDGHIDLKDPLRDVSDTNPGTGPVLSIVTVPKNIGAVGNFLFTIREGTGTVVRGWLRSLDQSSPAPLASNQDAEVATNTSRMSVFKQVRVSTSGEIRYRLDASTASTNVWIFTQGWTDKRNW